MEGKPSGGEALWIRSLCAESQMLLLGKKNGPDHLGRPFQSQ